MTKKKCRILQILLIFLLTATVQIHCVEPASVYAAEEAKETLTITGNGVSREVTFTREQLEQMGEATKQCMYSASNNFPTNKILYREGVLLEYLMEQAGIKDAAKQLKFISSDGYTKTFTYGELLETPRFYFSEDLGSTAGQSAAGILVPTIIAFSDSSKGFESMSPIELTLTMGQQIPKEQNNPWFVKLLSTIEVSIEEPEQWEPVTFIKTAGPDGVKVAPGHPHLDSVKIYYTLDGTNPTIHSQIYNISATYYQPELNKPILITEDKEIRAIAVGAGKVDSPIASTTVTFGGTHFADLSDYPWARVAIESLAEQKIISGMGDGRFAPEQTLTRAQFATMMVLAMEKFPYQVSAAKQADSPSFNDIRPTDWYLDYVKKAAEKGWINGYPDGSFRPQHTLSREEMITIAVQAVNRGDLSQDKADEALSSFTEETRISNWARLYVAAAEQMSILEHGHMVLNSDRGLSFDGQRQASRAEAAVIVYRLLNVMKEAEG